MRQTVRRSLTVRLLGSGRRPPAATADLNRAPGPGVLGQTAIQGGTAHSGHMHQLADLDAFVGGHAQREPQCLLCAGRRGPDVRLASGTTSLGRAGISWLGEPLDEADNEVVNFRRRGGGGQQESEDEAEDRLPDPKAHEPPGEINGDTGGATSGIDTFI